MLFVLASQTADGGGVNLLPIIVVVLLVGGVLVWWRSRGRSGR